MFAGPGFDDQDWYQALFEYGQATAGDADARNGGAGVGADDADNELIPRLARTLSQLESVIRNVAR